MDACLSYFVLSVFEVNMSCRLIFNSIETFNLSVCSRREFFVKIIYFYELSRTLRYERRDMF